MRKLSFANEGLARKLDELDPRTKSHRNLDVARVERRRLQAAVAREFPSPIIFEQNRSTIDVFDVDALRRLAASMNEKYPSAPAIPILLNGFASAEGAVGRNFELSLERAEAVKAVLAAEGVPQPLVALGLGPIGAPDDRNNRRVDIAPSVTFEAAYRGNRYDVAAHEFGHVLGLPDEYKDNPASAWQTGYLSEVAISGAPGPHQWGVRTSSIMASGVDVLPRHYVSLHEALAEMTDPSITRAQWKID